MFSGVKVLLAEVYGDVVGLRGCCMAVVGLKEGCRRAGPIVHRLVTERRVARPTALLKWSLIADPND